MFYKRLVAPCAEKNTNPTALCDALGFAQSAATRWKQGSIPRDTTLRKIADYFGVSVSYLIGEVDDPDPQALHGPDKKGPHLRYKLMETLGELTEDELEQVEHYLNFLLSTKKK